MPVISDISDHRAAVSQLPASDLFNALQISSGIPGAENVIYQLIKSLGTGRAICYIVITSKRPILDTESNLYDCAILGKAVYYEEDANGNMTAGEIGYREITNVISNKTHVASDNWLIYSAGVTEFNNAVDHVIDEMVQTTPVGGGSGILSIQDHREAVEHLPATDVYNALTTNTFYKLKKESATTTYECYVKLLSKHSIQDTEFDIYDCTIEGNAVYIEKDSSGDIISAEIGYRQIANLISNKTHVASDNWLIFASSQSEYNYMVDEVLNHINYTPPDPNHLSFTSKANNSTIYLTSKTPDSVCPDFEYSYDTVTWTPWTYSTSQNDTIYTSTYSTITLGFNERIYVRSHASTLGTDDANYYTRFTMSGRIEAAGNIQSLINYASSVPAYCYCRLFYDCNSLVKVPDLPATELGVYCYSYMFYICSGLTELPSSLLPAVEVPESAYSYMFNSCTNLINTPDLPATALYDRCYQYMFSGCTSLMRVSDLPATYVPSDAYYHMFYNCTSLAKPPKISGTTINSYCYFRMFYNCSALKTAPDLPALTLASNCYRDMFHGCTSLKEAPALRATTLVASCYQDMFYGCTSLEKCADMQRATNSTSNVCYNMYYGCSRLDNAIAPNVASWTTNHFTTWLGNVASTGTLYKNSSLTIPTDNTSGCPTGWSTADLRTTVILSAKGEGNLGFTYTIGNSGTSVTVNQGEEVIETVGYSDTIDIHTNSNSDVIKICGLAVAMGSSTLNYNDIVASTITCSSLTGTNPLCFTANTAGSTISMTHNGTNATTTKPVIYISTNGITYTAWDYSTITLANQGDKVYMFGTNILIGSNSSDRSTFVMTGSISASGNTNSLIGFSDKLSGYCYTRLFENCSSLTTAPTLPSDVRGAAGCYYKMFGGCCNNRQNMFNDSMMEGQVIEPTINKCIEE